MKFFQIIRVFLFNYLFYTNFVIYYTYTKYICLIALYKIYYLYKIIYLVCINTCVGCNVNNKEVISKNQIAWDKKVENSNKWSIPVTKEEIDKARSGIFNIKLTATKNVPRNWFPDDLKNKKILCLACGGGQQGPLLAAAGAIVTVFDISKSQLKQDEKVARENNLMISMVQGDMTHLECFKDNYFDLVFCPVSVTYIPDVISVFKESYRVLKTGGRFLFGSVNPLIYLFDNKKYDKGLFEVVNKLPFNSLDELNEKDKVEFINNKEAIEFSHTLQDLIGGQTMVGFNIQDFFEDIDEDKICNYTAKYFATKAVK